MSLAPLSRGAEASASTCGNDPGPAARARLDRRGGSRPSPGLPAAMNRAVTAVIIFGPFAGVVIAAVTLFGHGVSVFDLVLAALLYVVTGHGLSAGFHRLFSHRAFKATRWVKVSLAVAGSLAFEGSPNGWVANHRRHHAYTDQAGDPHSPYAYGTTRGARTRGLLHAHVGWLFENQPTDEARWAPDLVRDPDLVVISRLFPLFCVLSLAVPAVAGWAFTGTLSGAVGGLVWGGLVRVFLLHQSTFAVNSACHLWGKRPFVTRDADRASNFAPLAVVSLGDNWHNLHHSSPRLARHGVDRYQLDSTARLIWVLERLGAVSDVRWPDRAALDRRRTPKPAAVMAMSAASPTDERTRPEPSPGAS